ncbi:MAG: hypothetical protein L0Y66_06690 [Myxococcaceae bacterium]|nr:hypothetical protein [Myxococcaceae bacterium]MCI0669576.1 hypothetical protein [Myxococcaceae bacterium]
MLRTRVVPILVLALTSCTQRKEEAAPAPPPSVPTAPSHPTTPPPAPPELPGQAEAAARISSSIRFQGFGPARFGADEEAIRQAWGRGLEDGKRAEGSTCHVLFFRREGAGARPPISFMSEHGKFVRLDVTTPEYTAPGGGRIGMSADDIRTRYAGRLEEMPHKYVEGGRYLVVSPEEGGPTRLIFETDAGGKVTEWRIGLPPQVHYVEGCS